MKYMLLLNNSDQVEQTPEALEKIVSAMMEFNDEVNRRKVVVGGDRLAFPSSATTVRKRGGKTLVTDGPFAETKEWLGGYYIIDVKSLDEALEIASSCPAAEYGSVEIRPIFERPT